MSRSRWTAGVVLKYGIPSDLGILGGGSTRVRAHPRRASQRARRIAVKPAPFAYHRAGSVEQAVTLLAGLGDEAKILAGGLSLVPMMNLRLARPSALVDVTRVPGLSYLRPAPDGLHIGALTSHRTVEMSRDPVVTARFGVVPRSARWIGHY